MLRYGFTFSTQGATCLPIPYRFGLEKKTKGWKENSLSKAQSTLYKCIWNNNFPPHVGLQTLYNRNPKLENLTTRKIVQNDTCSYCQLSNKTCKHLTYNCLYARDFLESGATY